MRDEAVTQAATIDLAELVRLIRAIKIALLTTLDRDGQFHTRPVQTLQVEDDGTLWFFTDWSSPKVQELDRDTRVSVGFADPSRNTYVALSGLGTLLKDATKARALWSAEQRAFYPEGPDDPRLALLRVALHKAEYWIAPGRASYLIAAARAGATGEPVSVLGENRKFE
jgi:general stress protein 26